MTALHLTRCAQHSGENNLELLTVEDAACHRSCALEELVLALRVVPVSPEVDLPYLPFVFDIAMAVRRGDTALRDSLDAVLARRRGDIDRILADYGVPRADTPATVGSVHSGGDRSTGNTTGTSATR